jgi:hypothetical protein
LGDVRGPQPVLLAPDGHVLDVIADEDHDPPGSRRISEASTTITRGTDEAATRRRTRRTR